MDVAIVNEIQPSKYRVGESTKIERAAAARNEVSLKIDIEREMRITTSMKC